MGGRRRLPLNRAVLDLTLAVAATVRDCLDLRQRGHEELLESSQF
jgi:hypothetical protein